MSIIRGPRPNSNFYILDKKISEDRRLSWAARGMLIFLLGKPDHWTVSIQNLINETEDAKRQIGKTAVYSIMTELIEAGYVTRKKHASGELDYIVSETKEPDSGNPDLGNPDTDNPPLVSNEKKQGLMEHRRIFDELFDKFWSAYPRKVAKPQAQKAFIRIKGLAKEFASIMAGLERAKQEWSDPKFIPHPATWLNQRRWEDETTPVKGTSSNTAAPFSNPAFRGAR